MAKRKQESKLHLQQQQQQQQLLFHFIIIIIIIFIFLLFGAMAEEEEEEEVLRFEHAEFGSSNIADLVLVQEGDWYTGQPVSFTGSTIWLTPDPTTADPKVNDTIGNLGRLVYKDRFELVPGATSFSTSFTFRIVTNASVSGSGMAFFLSTSMLAPDYSQAGALGLTTYQNTTDLDQSVLAPPFPFFAVEFDTSLSPLYRDPSLSHVGIDLNSLVSANVSDTDDDSSPLFLYRNYTFTAWVEFDSRSSLIQVWMINDSAASRPTVPILTYDYDIASIFGGSPVYAGFSSANLFGFGNLEGLAMYAWNFSLSQPAAGDASSSASSRSALVVGLPIAAASIVAAIVACWIYRNRATRSSTTTSTTTTIDVGILAADAGLPRRHAYKELRKAAAGFSESLKIGEGGFSSVYLVKLPSSAHRAPAAAAFALKRLKDGLKKEQEFVSEIRIISALRHRNLLPLEGWCYERGEALLLYEYMARGSLDQYIFGKKKKEMTMMAASEEDAAVRLRILAGVAAGLEYLHTGLGDCIVHRDVKAENVLLRDDFEPVLCDFGLARLISRDQEVTLTAVGTPGYVAPELVYTGRGTDKADVYSFGVLALVVACGRRPIDPGLPPQESRIIDWVWNLYQNRRLVQALDPDIAPSDHWICILHLALTCCHPNPDARPTMRQAIQVMEQRTLLALPDSTPTYPMPSPWNQHSIISISQSQSSLQPVTSSSTDDASS